MEVAEDQTKSGGDPGSNRPPAPNTKASRARLYRERRKVHLSGEQLDDARKKNRWMFKEYYMQSFILNDNSLVTSMVVYYAIFVT